MIKENGLGKVYLILFSMYQIFLFLMNGCLFEAVLYWCEIMFFLSLVFEGLLSLVSRGLLWCSHLKLWYKYTKLWTQRWSYSPGARSKSYNVLFLSLRYLIFYAFWKVHGDPFFQMWSHTDYDLSFIDKIRTRLWELQKTLNNKNTDFLLFTS